MLASVKRALLALPTAAVPSQHFIDNPGGDHALRVPAPHRYRRPRAVDARRRACREGEWEGRSHALARQGARDPLQRATAADLELGFQRFFFLVKSDPDGNGGEREGRVPRQQIVRRRRRSPPSAFDWRGQSKVALRRIARRWLPERIHARRERGLRASDAELDSRMARVARRRARVFHRAHGAARRRHRARACRRRGRRGGRTARAADVRRDHARRMARGAERRASPRCARAMRRRSPRRRRRSERTITLTRTPQSVRWYRPP